jgi:hypothetical protein
MAQLQEFCELISRQASLFRRRFVLQRSCAHQIRGSIGKKPPITLRRSQSEWLGRSSLRVAPTNRLLTNGPGGHSIFTWTLLQGLQGLADTDGNGAITASELGAYISPIVSSVSHQTPAFWQSHRKRRRRVHFRTTAGVSDGRE